MVDISGTQNSRGRCQIRQKKATEPKTVGPAVARGRLVDLRRSQLVMEGGWGGGFRPEMLAVGGAGGVAAASARAICHR